MMSRFDKRSGIHFHVEHIAAPIIAAINAARLPRNG